LYSFNSFIRGYKHDRRGNVDDDNGNNDNDGNDNDGDGCDSNCTITTCGNGIVTAGEQCDNGGVCNGTSPACTWDGQCSAKE
jgi:hypothetical protein